jgi:hypothetical protein
MRQNIIHIIAGKIFGSEVVSDNANNKKEIINSEQLKYTKDDVDFLSR